jgi:membrane-bound lytic murein transglycosylase D
MNIKNKLTSILLLASASFFAQETTAQQDTILKNVVKVSYLDSIKATFVNDDLATCIDSLWMKELTSLDIYSTLLQDIKTVDIDKTVDYELPTELLKERLKRLDEKSPFNIEYNIGLENVIKSFLKNRKKGFERLMGISQFYFPIFEEELAKKNIPLEIKYLDVVESALNPLAVSRVGATGLWQFMYQTGKQYGLNISSYVDERSDPLKASQAASQYMENMYKIFGDWDLVLASYNSGPGNVAKAIRRSGGQQNYWNIRKNLPKETQGYLPAFLTTMYIFEYHKEHGIVPNKAIANHFATDTIMVKNHMTFKQISDLLDVPVAELKFFNPSYKRNEIPSISGERNFLRLPKDKIAIFASNEDKIYAYINYEANKRERPYERLASVKQNDPTNPSQSDSDSTTRTKYHKVIKGDNLSKIADKYNVTVSDIKSWNGLRSNSAPLGRKLKILSTEKIAFKENNDVAQTKAVADSVSTKETKIVTNSTSDVASNEAKPEKVYKTEKVVSYKDVTKYHKVKKGDVLGEIATKYDVSVADIKKWNNLKGSNIGLGDDLKIIKNEKVTTTVRKEVKQPFATKNEAVAAVEPKKVKAEIIKKEIKAETNSKNENVYVVAKGDNLSSIAKKFNISLEDLKERNNLIDNNIKLGAELIISDQKSTENNADLAKNVEHVVAKGEYLGTIARMYNTTINDLLELNSLSDTNIKEGDKLIVGKEVVTTKAKKGKEDYAATIKKANQKLYQVKQGDTLSSIAKKFPGVTIADLEKANNIKSENLKPGMKLKIGG